MEEEIKNLLRMSGEISEKITTFLNRIKNKNGFKYCERI